MTKKKAITLGIFTILPVLYYAVFLIYMFNSTNKLEHIWLLLIYAFIYQLSIFFIFTLPIHLLIIIETIALLVFYIIDIFKNNYIEKYKKILWILALLFFGIVIVIPIYWYINIWKPIKELTPSSPT